MSTDSLSNKRIAAAIRRAAIWGMVFVAASLVAACGAGGGGGGGGDGGGGAQTGTITVTADIPPGTTCPTGGQEIFYGIDENGNGVLDETERDGSVTICNGLGGAVLIAIGDEPAGGECPYGGDRVDVGLDNGDGAGTAGDGILQGGEIDNSYYICGYGSGLGDGTAVASLSLPAGQVHHTRVRAGGRSYYRFTAPSAGSHVIGLSRTDSDLGWTLYSDAFTTILASCDNFEGVDEDELCLTPLLTGGTTYYLAVTEQSGIPNLYDLSLAVPVLTAIDPLGHVFRIDPEFGTATFLSQSGLVDISSVAYLPQTGQMRAATGYYSDCGSCFFDMNPFTGYSETIVVYDWPEPGNLMDLSVDPGDGQLYGMESTECDNLRQINPSTGATVEIAGAPGYCYSNGLGLTFDGAGSLYLTASLGSLANVHLWYADPAIVADDGWVDVGALTFAGFGGAAPAYIVSMATDPATGGVYGIAVDETTYIPTHFLVSVDLTNAIASYLATLPYKLDGLAYIGGGRLPYLPIAGFGGSPETTDTLLLWWRNYPAADSFKIYWKTGSWMAQQVLAAYDGIITTGIAYDSTDMRIEGRHNYQHIPAPAPYSYVAVVVVNGAEVAYSQGFTITW